MNFLSNLKGFFGHSSTELSKKDIEVIATLNEALKDTENFKIEFSKGYIIAKVKRT